jgi:hypothetical protein
MTGLRDGSKNLEPSNFSFQRSTLVCGQQATISWMRTFTSLLSSLQKISSFCLGQYSIPFSHTHIRDLNGSPSLEPSLLLLSRSKTELPPTEESASLCLMCETKRWESLRVEVTSETEDEVPRNYWQNPRVRDNFLPLTQKVSKSPSHRNNGKRSVVTNPPSGSTHTFPKKRKVDPPTTSSASKPNFSHNKKKTHWPRISLKFQFF